MKRTFNGRSDSSPRDATASAEGPDASRRSEAATGAAPETAPAMERARAAAKAGKSRPPRPAALASPFVWRLQAVSRGLRIEQCVVIRNHGRTRLRFKMSAQKKLELECFSAWLASSSSPTPGNISLGSSLPPPPRRRPGHRNDFSENPCYTGKIPEEFRTSRSRIPFGEMLRINTVGLRKIKIAIHDSKRIFIFQESSFGVRTVRS